MLRSIAILATLTLITNFANGESAKTDEPIRLMCDTEWIATTGKLGTAPERWRDRHELRVVRHNDGTVAFESVASKRALRFESRRAPDTTHLADKSTSTAWVIEKGTDTGLRDTPPRRGFLWDERLSLDRNTGLLTFSREVTAPGFDWENSVSVKGFCEKIDTSKLKF